MGLAEVYAVPCALYKEWACRMPRDNLFYLREGLALVVGKDDVGEGVGRLHRVLHLLTVFLIIFIFVWVWRVAA